MKPSLIGAWDLNAAWWETCAAVKRFGKDYKITRGSYVGQQRRQLASLTVAILHPGNRPLAPICETPVTDNDAIEKYFAESLISSDIPDNAQYTYGSRISPHLKIIAEMLRTTPGTNQAVVEIARPEDIELPDPPCLRCLGWNIVEDTLQLSSFWRSWDIHGAMPVNLGGLQLLNEMMADWTGLKSGPLVAYSNGAHIYEHAWRMM